MGRKPVADLAGRPGESGQANEAPTPPVKVTGGGVRFQDTEEMAEIMNSPEWSDIIDLKNNKPDVFAAATKEIYCFKHWDDVKHVLDFIKTDRPGPENPADGIPQG